MPEYLLYALIIEKALVQELKLEEIRVTDLLYETSFFSSLVSHLSICHTIKLYEDVFNLTYWETEHTVPFGKTSKAFTDIFRLSAVVFPSLTRHPGIHKLSKWWIALRYGCFPVLRFSWINRGSNHFWTMSPSALWNKKREKCKFFSFYFIGESYNRKLL